MDGWTDGWTDGRTNGWMDIDDWRLTFTGHKALVNCRPTERINTTGEYDVENTFCNESITDNTGILWRCFEVS